MASRPPAEVGSARMLRQAAAADSSDPRRAEGRRAVQGAQWNGSRSEQEAPRSTNGVRDAPARAFGDSPRVHAVR